VNPPRIALFARPFWFLRHGETVANASRIIAGSLDVDLTESGHRQAQAAAAALEGAGITAIHSSALRRARDTADHVARRLGLPVTVIPQLNERYWGVLEGQPRADRAPGTAPPDAEPVQAFAARVLAGLATIAATDVPLVVGHSGVFRVLCRTLGLDEPVEPVTNAQPLRLVPPEAASTVWRIDRNPDKLHTHGPAHKPAY